MHNDPTLLLQPIHWAIDGVLVVIIWFAIYFWLAISERNYRGTPLFSFGRNSFGSWWGATFLTVWLTVLVIVLTGTGIHKGWWR